MGILAEKAKSQKYKNGCDNSDNNQSSLIQVFIRMLLNSFKRSFGYSSTKGSIISFMMVSIPGDL